MGEEPVTDEDEDEDEEGQDEMDEEDCKAGSQPEKKRAKRG
jgi:hypothetical protein